MTEKDNYILSIHNKTLNENVRLQNEVARLKEVVKFQEEELAAIQAEHEEDMREKDLRIESLTADACEYKRKYEEEQALTRRLKEELSSIKADKDNTEKALADAAKALKDKDDCLALSEKEKDDIQAVVETLRRKMFGRNSERSRFLDGEVIIDGDSADTMGLGEILKRVDKAADALLSSDDFEIDLMPDEKEKEESKQGKQNDKTRNDLPRRKGKGPAKRKPRYTFTADVLNHYGIDTSGLPAGAKLIRRKDKESGYDIWVLRVIHYHKARVTIDEHEIGRFNSPGSDPVSSAPPKTILPGNPLMPSFASFYIDQKIGYCMSENRMLAMLKDMNAYIPQSSLNKWMHEIISHMRENMQPEMIALMNQAYSRQCDEVRLIVRSRESEEEQFKYNTEWIHMHLSPELKLVVMEYDKGSRSHEVQMPLMEDLDAYIFLADRAPLYLRLVKALQENNKNVIRAADYVHARRVFVEAYDSDKRMIHIINIINTLIMIDNEMSRKGVPPDERLAYRLKHSRKLVTKLMNLLEKIRSMGNEFGAMVHRAVNYVLDDKEAFMVFLQYGEVEIQNNAAYPNFLVIQTFLVSA